jgi:hypothetical protein
MFRVFKFTKIKFDGQWTMGPILGNNIFEYKPGEKAFVEIVYMEGADAKTATIEVIDRLVYTHLDVVHVYGKCISDVKGDNVKCPS